MLLILSHTPLLYVLSVLHLPHGFELLLEFFVFYMAIFTIVDRIDIVHVRFRTRQGSAIGTCIVVSLGPLKLSNYFLTKTVLAVTVFLEIGKTL